MTAAADPTLGWSIGVLFRGWQQQMADALSELPHGGRGFQILITVARNEPPTQAALAGHLGIDRTVLTYVLDDLVAAGLLERQPDAADRRARRLVVTESGRDRLAILETRVSAAEAALLAGLSPTEQQTLRHALHRAAEQIHLGDADRDACTVAAEALADTAQPAARAPRRRSSAGRQPTH